MRKYLLVIVFLLFISTVYAETDEVEVIIPDFDVRVNDVLINTQESQYPILSYNNITYFPMTSDYVQAIGLTLKFNQNDGLEISKNGQYSELEQRFLGSSNQLNSVHKAELVPFKISVNGKVIDNSKETYPLLLYKNITYFPMTWRFCVDEFDWTTKWDDKKGFEIICNYKESMSIETNKEESSIELSSELITWTFDEGVHVSVEDKSKAEKKLLVFASNILENYFDEQTVLKPFTIHVLMKDGVGFARQDNGEYTLNLSESYFDIFNESGNYFILYHEFVHILDFQNFDFWIRSFREGLADFLAIEQRKLDTSDQISLYLDKSLTEDELNDFSNHLLECEYNGEALSPYYSGFFFYQYLTKNYGNQIIGQHVNYFYEKKPPFEQLTFEVQRTCIIDSLKAVTNDQVYKDFSEWFSNK